MEWNYPLWLTTYVFPVIDILLVSYIIYKMYTIISETIAMQVFKGIIIFVLAFVFARMFQLKTFDKLLSNVLNFGVIAIIVLFHPELRRLLMKMGQSNILNFLFKEEEKTLDEIIHAVEVLVIRDIHLNHFPGEVFITVTVAPVNCLLHAKHQKSIKHL